MQPRRFTSLVQSTPLEQLLPRLLETLNALTPEELGRVLVQLDAVTSVTKASAEKHADLAKLTSRERQAFDLVAHGASNVEIARTMGISVKTVQTHRAQLNKKLGLHSPAEVVRFAVRMGLFSA